MMAYARCKHCLGSGTDLIDELPCRCTNFKDNYMKEDNRGWGYAPEEDADFWYPAASREDAIKSALAEVVGEDQEAFSICRTSPMSIEKIKLGNYAHNILESIADSQGEAAAERLMGLDFSTLDEALCKVIKEWLSINWSLDNYFDVEDIEVIKVAALQPRGEP